MSNTDVHTPSVEEFAESARSWLSQRLEPAEESAALWGEGSDDVSVFHRLSFEEEKALLGRLMS